MGEQSVKEYDELLFTDDFLFCKVLENNEDLCTELLELILGKKIRKINYLAKQKIIDITSDGKGADYEDLKKSYIIFICMQNPFKRKELHLYTFENRCNESVDLFLGDESTKVILTPEGAANDVSTELTEFLNFLAGRDGNSSFVKRLKEAVNKAKNKEEWRMEYMTLLMRDREKFAEGKAEGMQQERIDAVQRMIRKGYSKEDILELEYTEEEFAEAEARGI